jgi:hypothetical protein
MEATSSDTDLKTRRCYTGSGDGWLPLVLKGFVRVGRILKDGVGVSFELLLEQVD